jgi:hypothetical protein
MKNEYKLISWKRNGARIEAPAGCNVSDYFRGGKYLGPDEDGVEPVLHIRYEDGVHVTQYFTNEHGGWMLVGYDGVLREVPEGLADFLEAK